MACCLVFEPRREEGTLGEKHLPRGTFPEALEKTQLLWARLDDVERGTACPAATRSRPASRWR
ncbi:hypothetical protein [Rathayibacter oskolensis]|uniref:hypothetical protein n=1 Tax=Rathayibacter oskolensis TaxID=1891671 RepID=UPI003F5D516E